MEQRSDEWIECRKGKMTASNSYTISVGGKGLESYIYNILAEKYSISNDEESYMSSDMIRGVEKEEQARMTYELQYEEVEQVGFIEMNEYFGASPDGLIAQDGGQEIKCVNNTNFFRIMVDGESAIDKKYLWQVQGCLLASGRKWWDLCFWNGNFENNLIVFRILPDLAMQEKLIVGIEKGKQLSLIHISEPTRPCH
jgi:putative phage-type endonuclease